MILYSCFLYKKNKGKTTKVVSYYSNAMIVLDPWFTNGFVFYLFNYDSIVNRIANRTVNRVTLICKNLQTIEDVTKESMLECKREKEERENILVLLYNHSC